MFYNILKNVKIIEYSNFISAPFCGKLLADLGAEVIKVEEPGRGDDCRGLPPISNNQSGLFQYLNMNKHGITLNLGKDKGRKILAQLVAKSDVFIENIPRQKREAQGITYEFLKAINPDIIMTSISPFGQTGPYRDYKGSELIIDHMSGVGYASTREVEATREPLMLPAHLLSFQAGLSAAVVTMGAIYKRKTAGEGSFIDVSELESAIQNLAIPLARYSYADQVVARTDVLDRAPFHILPCKDGYIYHAFVHEYQWDRFVELMGKPYWAGNELFKDYRSRGIYWDALRPLMIEWTMQHSMEEIYRRSQEMGAPIGAVYTASEILESAQLAARDFFSRSGRPGDKTAYPGIPFILSDTRKEIPSVAPELGEHNDSVFGGLLCFSKDELNKLQKDGII